MAGLFGGFKLPPLPGPISGYGGGTFNMDGTQATPVDTQPFIPTGDFGPRPAGIDQAAAYTGPAKKGGLFGSKFNEPGGWGEKLALIGSVLTQDGGNNPNVQGIMLRRQMEAAAQRAQAQRQAELQNQMALYDYKRANPEPANDSFTRALKAAGIQPGTPEYVALARKRAEMLTNPVQLVPDGFGGVQPVRVYGEDGEQEAPPTAPVGRLIPYNGGPGSSGGMFP